MPAPCAPGAAARNLPAENNTFGSVRPRRPQRRGRSVMTVRMPAIRSRRFALARAAFAGLTAGPASGADYPTKPVRWIVPYPPAGTTDILARLIGNYLSEHLGQTFIIENKAGGGNN